jgi:hypothetical protein
MTLVTGPNLRALVTDAALVALGHPGSVLLPLWRVLEQHGQRRTAAEYAVESHRLRVVPGRDGGLVIGTHDDFAEAAA